MIYFDRALQSRVLDLFDESLVRFGILGLGHKESLRNTGLAGRYDEIDAAERLYRKAR
jgi:chemotaxis protein methyltransferase CheR